MHLSRVLLNAGRQSAALLLFVLALGALPGIAAAAGTTTGELKTAVLLVNFQGDTSQPITVADANTMVFGKVSDFYWEASYEKTFLGGATYGWYTLPLTNTYCNTYLIAREANAAAAAAGVDLTQYSQVVYLFPHISACSWSGANDLGDRGEHRVYVNGAISPKVIAHELGHRYGLLHSDSLDCGAAAFGSSCVRSSYGDAADTMGNRFAHFNAFQKERLGWFNGVGSPVLSTVTSSGRYKIEPYETKTVGVKALKILKSSDPATGKMSWYYLEYRQPQGFDSSLATEYDNLTKGILLRTGTLTNGTSPVSVLLDTTPESIENEAFDVMDGALEPGRSVVDPDTGIAFSLVSMDATGAIIDISLGASQPQPCTRTAPTITLGGPTTAVAAGATNNYTVTLSNRDSSACSVTSFSLAGSVPTGWVGALAASSLSLSPGASASTTFAVTSPANAATGGFGIGVGASSNVGGAHTASAAASYTVGASNVALTETVGTDKAAYLRGETVTMSARVLNAGVAVAQASVQFTITLPSGSAAVLKAVTGSDGFARSSYKVGKGKAAIGSYQLRADASSSGASATATSSFTVR